MFKKSRPSHVKICLMVAALLNQTEFAYADNEKLEQSNLEKTYLVQIINQLNALQPLVLSAERAQISNKRIQFHYSQYQDSQGKWHHGLLEDIHSIKTGVLEYLSQPAIEPRVVEPLKNDYLNLKPVPRLNTYAGQAVDSRELEHDNR